MADKKHTTDVWILLSEAHALAAQFFGSSFAKRWLLERLEGGQLQWRCLSLRDWHQRELSSDSRSGDDPRNGDRAFWDRRFGFGGVDWDESSVYGNGMSAYGIQVPRNDLLAQLPFEHGQPTQVEQGGKAWIITEVQRMKAAGEITQGAKKAEIARELHNRMKKAARAGSAFRLWQPRTIENRMREWKLL